MHYNLKSCLLVIFLAFAIQLMAQQPVISMLDSGRPISIRGLSVVNNKVIWASGSHGTVARSTDSGKTFEWLTVAGYKERDFRDIEAFDADTAIIMAIAEPAIILKTKDGGKNWYKVFEDSAKGMFLDAMDFNDKGDGIVIGDPVDGTLFRAYTENWGASWTVLKISGSKNIPARGEAFFASSGTNLVITGKKKYPVLYVSGGIKSRLNNYYDLNIIQGKETTGANSIAVDLIKKNAVIVGGDFKADTSALLNCVLVKLGKKPLFKNPEIPPRGYRSCVAYITNKKLLACGTSGIDISNDGGKNWQLISTQSFHVCQKAKKGSAVFLAGANGKIARLNY